MDAPILYDGTPSAGVPVIGCVPTARFRVEAPSENTAFVSDALPASEAGCAVTVRAPVY